MLIKKDIPFVKSRGFECGQACAAMIIKYYKPDFKAGSGILNKIIHHKKGKYTFPLQLAILINHYRLKVKCYSSDDYKLIEEDPGMFRRWFGKDEKYEMQFINKKTFNWMVLAGRRIGLFKKKKTDFNEIIELFKKRKIVAFPIDWNSLMRITGPYVGHFVVMSGIEEDKILLHDPDVGPYVSYPKERVEKAYSHPAITDDLIVVSGRKK